MKSRNDEIMKSMFVSYARGDYEFIKSFAQDLLELDHVVWYDNELTGGQSWWDQVLLKIRECDLFLFGLSPESLGSQACRLERGYARSLAKIVVPILIADNVDVNLLPADLAQIHYVDYRRADKRSLISLLRALHRLPPEQPLPSPLPAPPTVPVSYLGNLKERIEGSQLSSEQQSELLLTLKHSLKDTRERSGAIALLRQMRERQDLLARIDKEIEEILRSPLAEIESKVETKGPLKAEATEPPIEADAFTSAIRKWTKVFEVKSPVVDAKTGPASVTGIYVAHGDNVRKDQKLIELEYEKAVEEVLAPSAGVVQKIHISTGDKIASGVHLLVIESTDWPKARAEIQALAERGDVNAQHSLAAMYHEGLGVAVDLAQAAVWNLKAAEGGHKEAQYHVAVMYAFGRGVTKSKEQAVKWFNKAAAQGHANAQYNLALRYASGEGVSPNEKEAIKWFQRAARQKHTKAQDELKKRGVK